MNLATIGIGSLWSGLFAVAVGVLLTAPRRDLAGILLCAVGGRVARDVLASCGLPPNWATVAAAAVIVWIAVATIRGRRVSPVVLISSVLPLGAARAMFHTIVGVMRISTLQGEALGAASTELMRDMGQAFTTTLAIALGLVVGVAVVRLFRRQALWEDR